MKEIKFRAWHKELKIIFEPEAIWFSTPGRKPWLNNSHDYRDEYRGKLFGYVDDDIILMQYTGLNDKKGNEIYEGDILHDLLHPEQYFLVRYEDAEFGLELLKPYVKECMGGISERLHDVCYDSEVVGNIYENPELLEVKP